MICHARTTKNDTCPVDSGRPIWYSLRYERNSSNVLRNVIFGKEKCMEQFMKINTAVNGFVWGPVMLALLVGTGIYLMFRMRFLPLRNLGYALKCLFQKEDKKSFSGVKNVMVKQRDIL